MKMKDESIESILFEDGERFYALYKIYDESLKIIDMKTKKEKEIAQDLSVLEAFKKLDQISKEDFIKIFQKQQGKLFFMDGDNGV